MADEVPGVGVDAVAAAAVVAACEAVPADLDAATLSLAASLEARHRV